MKGDLRKRERIKKPKVLAFNVPNEDRDSIRTILEADGYTVASASGDDIVEATRREQPDLIFVNAFPRWTEAVKKLRSDIRYLYTPIFLLSEDLSSLNREQGVELGIRGSLSRPIDPQRLLGLLQRGGSESEN
jgi:CheY-like chemotaxis protein